MASRALKAERQRVEATAQLHGLAREFTEWLALCTSS